MTTSLKSKRRPVNFEVFTTSYVMGRPSSPPTHPPPPPVTPRHSVSLCFFFLFFFFLCKLNLKKRHTHTHTNTFHNTHTPFLFTPSRQRVSALKWQVKLFFFGGGAVGSFPWVTHTHTLPSSSTSQPHHTLPPSSSSSSSPHFIWLPIFFFFIIHSVTRLSVNIAFLSTWQSEHKSPPHLPTSTPQV